MRNYQKWEITLLARRMAVDVYHLLQHFPADERFALCQQLRRASTSVGANIAEGGGRETSKDIARFLSQAVGSVCEVEFLLLLSQDLKFITEAQRLPLAKSLETLKFKIYRLRHRILKD
jgi:four helix bundle protein